MPDTGTAPYSRRRARRLWLVMLIMAIAAGGAYWLFGRAPGGAPQSSFGGPGAGFMGGGKVPVKVAQARAESIDLVFKSIGTVTAYNTVTVSSRVDGLLQEILFEDGQKVEQGDLLAQIDPRPYQAQLDQALGQQKQDQAQLENARRDLQRYQLLYKQNSIARQQVDTQAALVEQYLGRQKTNQAAVDNARLQLGFTKITAPIGGRLGLRNIDQGNLIASSTAGGLVTITQTQPISVLFTLPQSQLPQVLQQMRAGTPLRVELYDRGDTLRLASGRLASADNQIDVATGTVRFKARFENEDETLFPNQFVNVRLRVSTRPDATVIPSQALQQGSIGAFVYVVGDDDKVRIQAVTAGMVEDDRVAILRGLQPGQRVVTDGVDRLREGAQVDVVTPEAQAQTAEKAARAATRQEAPGARRRPPR